MKWTLREIREYPEDIMPFEEKLSIETALKQREPSIISVEEIMAKGYLSVVNEAIILHATVDASLTLPSSRSLEPVKVQLEIPIKERYVAPEDDLEEDLSEETTLILDHDYVDLEEAVMDSILINLPQRVIGPGEEEGPLPAGNDWEVLTEDQFEARLKEEKANTIDPRFEALKTLFNEDQ